MNTRALAISGAAVAGLVMLVAWAFKWELGRAATLAPLIVVGVGAAAGVAVVLGRALLESARAVRRPRLVFGLTAVGIVLLFVLSLLGVELPRE